jgi:hypothetical protein
MECLLARATNESAMGKINTQAAFEAVLEFVTTELKKRIHAFLQRAEDSLQDQWQGIRVTNERLRAKSAAEWLSQHKGWVEKAMHERLIQSLTDQLPPKDLDFTELRVLGDEAVGVIMIRAKLINQLMETARYEVAALEMRLETLRQDGAKLNPKALGPGLIVDGFIGVLEALGANESVQTLMLESYGETGVRQLIDLYVDLNQLLINAGVMPRFQFVIKQEAYEKAQALTGRPETSFVESFESAELPQDSGWRPKLSGKHPPPEPSQDSSWRPMLTGNEAPSPLPAKREITTPELARVLEVKFSSMQEIVHQLSVQDWRPGKLREMLDMPPPVQLNKAQEQSIDHIEALFIDLLNDQRISMRIRSELNRLILPTITLRLAVPEEFTTSNNPARVFVRQLAVLGYRDEEAPLVDFNKIQIVVDRIVSEQGQDLGGFRSGAQVLYTLARKEVQRRLEARMSQRVPAESATPMVEQPATLPAAEPDVRELVLIELRELAAGMPLPEVAKQFTLRVLGPWMLAQLQKFGLESREWGEARSFADILFDVLRPAISEVDRSRKRALRRYALLEARDRMLAANLDEDVAQEMLGQLEHHLISMDSLVLGANATETDTGVRDKSLDFLNKLPMMDPPSATS